MADSNQYLSVLTPATATGVIQLRLESYDASSNVTFTTSSIAINSGDSEETIAIKLKNALDSELVLATYNFDGQPVFSAELPNATWRIARTNHILNIWSECQYSLSITSNTTGALINQGSEPTFQTIAYAKAYGAISGQNFQDSVGDPLPDATIALMLAATSSEIVLNLNNPIVATGHVHYEIGNWTPSVFLKFIPLILWDPPVIRRPNMYNVLPVTTSFSDVRSNYTVNYLTGEVNYRFTQNLIQRFEPFDYYNEIKLSYVAGYTNIPAIVKNVGVDYLQFMDVQGIVESLAGGTFKIAFKDEFSHKKEALFPLSSFYISK